MKKKVSFTWMRRKGGETIGGVFQDNLLCIKIDKEHEGGLKLSRRVFYMKKYYLCSPPYIKEFILF